MTLAGAEEAARMFELCGAEARIVSVSGTSISAGMPILAVTGAGGALHRGYKIDGIDAAALRDPPAGRAGVHSVSRRISLAIVEKQRSSSTAVAAWQYRP